MSLAKISSPWTKSLFQYLENGKYKEYRWIRDNCIKDASLKLLDCGLESHRIPKFQLKEDQPNTINHHSQLGLHSLVIANNLDAHSNKFILQSLAATGRIDDIKRILGKIDFKDQIAVGNLQTVISAICVRDNSRISWITDMLTQDDVKFLNPTSLIRLISFLLRKGDYSLAKSFLDSWTTEVELQRPILIKSLLYAKKYRLALEVSNSIGPDENRRSIEAAMHVYARMGFLDKLEACLDRSKLSDNIDLRLRIEALVNSGQALKAVHLLEKRGRNPVDMIRLSGVILEALGPSKEARDFFLRNQFHDKNKSLMLMRIMYQTHIERKAEWETFIQDIKPLAYNAKLEYHVSRQEWDKAHSSFLKMSSETVTAWDEGVLGLLIRHSLDDDEIEQVKDTVMALAM